MLNIRSQNVFATRSAGEKDLFGWKSLHSCQWDTQLDHLHDLLYYTFIYKLLIIGPWYIFWLTVPLLNLLHPSIHVMFTWVLLIYLYHFYSYIWDTRCTAGYISLITMKQLPCFPCLFVKMSVFYNNEYGISTECFL